MPSQTHTTSRSRRVLGAVVAAGLIAAVAPSAADAKIVELGQTSTRPTPSCPAKPCLAVSRTTGYQVKVGEARDIFIAPRGGKVVAWTIQLGAPTAKQVKFFNTTLGGAPSAGISVVHPAARLRGTITGQSPVMPLTDYLGETVQFPLATSLSVKKGDRVALTVPTWAPALAVGFGADTSWRASRTQKQCDDTETQTAVSKLGAVTQFRCLYKTARLTYTVTMITDPHGPPKQPKKKS